MFIKIIFWGFLYMAFLKKIALVSIAGVSFAACSQKSTLSSNSVLTVEKKESIDGTGSKDLVNQNVKKEFLFKGVEGFLVKNSDQIRATINECLDANLLTVQSAMLSGGGAGAAGTGRNMQPPPSTPTAVGDGRKVILPGNFSPVAGDIVEQLAADLYSPLKTSRSETSASLLSLNYMGALASVADVVAWNCDFSDPAARCNCSTKESAQKILQRCIPSYSDAELAPVVEAFAASCSVADVAKKREALASFISSTTFAEAR